MHEAHRLIPPGELSDARRPIRLRLARGADVITDVLLVQHVSGQAAMCGGFEYRLLCVAGRAGLPLSRSAPLRRSSSS